MKRVLTVLGVIGVLAATGAAAACGETDVGSSPKSTPASQWGTAPDGTLQFYWYCWNDGHAGPHHLGHRVIGDHLCTVGELKRYGM